MFIAPPTTVELERRLRGRGTESDEQIKHRLENAAKEMERQAALFLAREPAHKEETAIHITSDLEIHFLKYDWSAGSLSLGPLYSLKEKGLYDYVLFNRDVDVSVKQLAAVAQRALAGQVNLNHLLIQRLLPGAILKQGRLWHCTAWKPSCEALCRADADTNSCLKVSNGSEDGEAVAFMPPPQVSCKLVLWPVSVTLVLLSCLH